jgi:hypothetical protein
MTARGEERDPGGLVLTVQCSDTASAEKVLGILEAAGIPAGDVSVLLRGVDVEERWLADQELKKKGGKPRPESRPFGPYARRISEGRRLLLEGCWAVGPLFFRTPGTVSSQGIESLSMALLHAGIDVREAARVEAAVRRPGGVWLAVEGDPEALQRVESRLPRSESVAAGRLRIQGRV